MTGIANLSAETIASITTDDQYNPWVNKSFGGVQTYLTSIFVNHTYFQLANVFFLLSYFAPNSRCGFIYLRFMFLTGCVFYAVWGFGIHGWKDALVWNVTFIFCNIIHLVVLLLRIWPMKFSKEIEDVSNASRTYRIPDRTNGLMNACLCVLSVIRRGIQAVESESKTIQNAVEMHQSSEGIKIPRTLRSRKSYQGWISFCRTFRKVSYRTNWCYSLRAYVNFSPSLIG